MDGHPPGADPYEGRRAADDLASESLDDVLRHQWLLQLLERLTRRVDLQAVVRRPQTAPWSLTISSMCVWRRVWPPRRAVVVYCGGTIDVFFFVTSSGELLGTVEDIDEVTARVATKVIGPRRVLRDVFAPIPRRVLRRVLAPGLRRPA